MNNPNPNYGAENPDDDIDAERFIEHFMDSLDSRQTEICLWMKNEGFLDVRVRPLPVRGPDSFEVLAIRGESGECRTFDHVFAIVGHLARDLGLQVKEDEFCAVVWGDRVGTQFRLRPRAD